MNANGRFGLRISAGLALLSLLLSGCGAERAVVPTDQILPSVTAPAAPGRPDEVPDAGIAIRSPMTISNNLLPGAAGKDVYLRVQLYRGTYSEDWRPGAYTGTRYMGHYQIVIADADGRSLSVTRLDRIFLEPMMFTNHFVMAFDDYNGDGFPDFTLGQRADNYGGQYKILTLAKDLTVQELPVRGVKALYVSKGEPGGSNYSVKLRKSRNGVISFAYYNAEQGQYIDRFLKWQDGQFVSVSG